MNSNDVTERERRLRLALLVNTTIDDDEPEYPCWCSREHHTFFGPGDPPFEHASYCVQAREAVAESFAAERGGGDDAS